MFALRGIAVSFSVFLIVYCAASLAVLCTWNRVYQRERDHYCSGRGRGPDRRHR